MQRQPVLTLTSGMFLILFLTAIFVAFDFPLGPLAILLVVAIFIFSFRCTYLALNIAIALTPFLGIMLSIPTGRLVFGERAFGGYIDISVADGILLFVLAAWAGKIILYWRRRRDQQWKPRFPILGSYAALFCAHLVSVFSPFASDPILVMKFAIRPVLFNYLAFVVLPVNLLRSRHRLVSALAVISVVGSLAALTGFISIFSPSGPSDLAFRRAHPIPLFGVSALGENHNELADILVFTTAACLALSRLIASVRLQRLLVGAAIFQFTIGLLTFARTAWFVFFLQALFLVATVWRASIKRHVRALCIVGLFLLPLATVMAAYSVSHTAQSSNSTRHMLSQIAWTLFQSSPVFGAGAGSFVERVGSTRVFVLEYGNPLDSHGFLQKLAAETGLLGLFAITAVFIHLALLWFRGAKFIANNAARQAYFLLLAGAGGAIIYQLFNTEYWSGKMWLPVGIVLAAASVLHEQAEV